jgi:hypothetical protein
MTGQDLIDEFEAAGDEVVRGNVLLNRYEAEKRYAAELWLREREEARRRVLTRDEIYIARSSKDAAWSAAEAAREAAKSARSANFFAAIWPGLRIRHPHVGVAVNTLAISAPRATVAGCGPRPTPSAFDRHCRRPGPAGKGGIFAKELDS